MADVPSIRHLVRARDHVDAHYAELGERGVEFNDPPTQMPYGVDTSFRDPSGNNVRLAQLHPTFFG